MTSLLLGFELAGCTTDLARVEDPDLGTLAQTDWLMAWWNTSLSEPTQHTMLDVRFSRWLSQTLQPDEEEVSPVEEDISLWSTVGNQVTLVDWRHPRIQREASFYAHHPRFLDQVTDRAEPYFHFILQELRERNMPVEVALLPIVESAYEPRATSSHHAAGIWQLIPGTARHWGLDLNRHYDGRRDVLASTHAALDYLQKLNHEFDGDWLLTMAAYNCGEGGVESAIQRNLTRGKPIDFWSLDLPSETRSFVPRILGLAALISEPRSYGVQLKTLRDIPVVPVRIQYSMDLARVAELADVPLAQVRRLNPAYRQGKTDPEGSLLLLPTPQAQAFEARLASNDF